MLYISESKEDISVYLDKSFFLHTVLIDIKNERYPQIIEHI